MSDYAPYFATAVLMAWLGPVGLLVAVLLGFLYLAHLAETEVKPEPVPEGPSEAVMARIRRIGIRQDDLRNIHLR